MFIENVANSKNCNDGKISLFYFVIFLSVTHVG